MEVKEIREPQCLTPSSEAFFLTTNPEQLERLCKPVVSMKANDRGVSSPPHSSGSDCLCSNTINSLSRAITLGLYFGSSGQTAELLDQGGTHSEPCLTTREKEGKKNKSTVTDLISFIFTF